ncbi:hypothetical protein G6F68_019309 [Rhizopus microsporus]|nr:hypothetical protein G6F68_019309 [Rhizopus microsporus]
MRWSLLPSVVQKCYESNIIKRESRFAGRRFPCIPRLPNPGRDRAAGGVRGGQQAPGRRRLQMPGHIASWRTRSKFGGPGSHHVEGRIFRL